MLSAWIAVFDGRARLDRPGLVQYRTLTEYSTSHRPSTRASRTKDAAAAPAPRPARVLRWFVASVRTRSSKYTNEYFICNLKVWSHSLESNGMLRAYFTRVSIADVFSPRRSATEWREVRGATRAQLSRRLPPRASPHPAPALYRSGKWFLNFPTMLTARKFHTMYGENISAILENWKLWSLTRSALATCRRPQWRITKLFAWFDSKFMWSDCWLTVCLLQ